MKHDVRSCGCNFAKYPLHIRREKQWFQFQLQAAILQFCKFCQARRHLNLEHFQPSTRTISFTARKFLVYLVKLEDHQKTEK